MDVPADSNGLASPIATLYKTIDTMVLLTMYNAIQSPCWKQGGCSSFQLVHTGSLQQGSRFHLCTRHAPKDTLVCHSGIEGLLVVAQEAEFAPRVDSGAIVAAVVASIPPIVYWAQVVLRERNRIERQEKEQREKDELKKKLFGDK